MAGGEGQQSVIENPEEYFFTRRRTSRARHGKYPRVLLTRRRTSRAQHDKYPRVLQDANYTEVVTNLEDQEVNIANVKEVTRRRTGRALHGK